MITPWASRAWKLYGDVRALDAMKIAAQTLLDRCESGGTEVCGFHDQDTDKGGPQRKRDFGYAIRHTAPQPRIDSHQPWGRNLKVIWPLAPTYLAALTFSPCSYCAELYPEEYLSKDIAEQRETGVKRIRAPEQVPGPRPVRQHATIMS